MDFGPRMNAISEYIPENERPDISTVIQYFNQQIAAGKEAVEVVNGREWAPCFNAEMADWAYHIWNPKMNDVIVSSFSKTGTTWVRNIANCIINKDDEEVKQMVKKMTMPHLYLETGLPKKFEMLDKLPWKQKILSTHLPVELINMEKIRTAGAKIICTIRNPKDTAVSYYHMQKNLQQFDENWDKFYEKFILGKICLMMKEGEWYLDHLLGWYKHKDDDNVLFVVYEELQQNPRKEIQRIANFLEVYVTDEEVSEIVEATSFQTMKSKSDEIDKYMNFFRKGKVGDWKNYFTEAQSELMDQKVKEKLSFTDISFIYE